MTTITVQPYERQHQQLVLDLLFYARRTHAHLDWYRIGTWLDLAEAGLVATAWHDQHLIGVIGVALPLGKTTWIRLCAVDNNYDPEVILGAMWEHLLQHELLVPIEQVGCLVVNRWLMNYLPLFGFHYNEDVVTLSRVGTDLPSLPAHPFTIQNAYLDALPDLIQIDHQAFSTLWQMTRDEIRQAQRQSATCTVALLEGQLIGYQISTRYQNTAHLARLAVLPQFQGQGVGAVLLDQLINGLLRRNVRAITVNTQQSNMASQRLYNRYLFRRNGYDLPVWLYNRSSANGIALS